MAKSRPAAAVLCGLLGLLCGGCGLFGHKAPKPAPVASFPVPLHHPVNIQVLDQRPSEETVADPTYASGYAYSTYGADDQMHTFVASLALLLQQGKAITAYRDINAGDAGDPAGLQFNFVLQHWYAKWPILNTQYPLLIEGELDVDLRVLKAGQVVYEQQYQTTGTPTYADLSTIDDKHYANFIPDNLHAKANQLLAHAVKAIDKDLAANWDTIVAADGS